MNPRQMTRDEDVVMTTQPILPPTVHQMVKARCEEHARLAQQAKAISARQTQLSAEVDTLLAQAGQGEALLDGIVIDGHRLKLVAGETKSVNFETLVRLGCDPEWIQKATTRVPKKTYIRFTHPDDEG